jgi:hypothetical protein
MRALSSPSSESRAVSSLLLQHGALRIHLGLLAHQHDSGLGQHPPLAGARGLQPRQYPHQGGFARAVGADQPEPLPLADVQAEPVKQGADAEILADINQADQAQDPVCCR